jgi:hypothetical protein
MTVTTEAPARTLADAKECLTGLLLHFADHVKRDVSECPACAKSIEDRCPEHAEDAAAQARYEHAAGLVAHVATREELWAAFCYAAPEEAERGLVADLNSITGGTK